MSVIFSGHDGDTKGPADTYLNGHAHGWPNDHKAEDTFDIPHGYPVSPPQQPLPYEHIIDTQYVAEYTPSGGVSMFLVSKKTIASFDTFADAQLAAEALNNLKGY